MLHLAGCALCGFGVCCVYCARVCVCVLFALRGVLFVCVMCLRALLCGIFVVCVVGCTLCALLVVDLSAWVVLLLCVFMLHVVCCLHGARCLLRVDGCCFCSVFVAYLYYRVARCEFVARLLFVAQSLLRACVFGLRRVLFVVVWCVCVCSALACLFGCGCCVMVLVRGCVVCCLLLFVVCCVFVVC